MNLVRRSWLVILMTLFVGASGYAQGRVQLAQGHRAIQDKVSFVVDIVREKRYANDPRYAERYAEGPDNIRIWFRLTGHPTSGKLYIDGKAVGRFDETSVFTSNQLDITYGRHVITLAVTSPTTLSELYVDVSGGLAREILDDGEPGVTLAPDLSKRVIELERKVQDLETELAGLKKKRNH